jgi:chromosome segregation ATPase
MSSSAITSSSQKIPMSLNPCLLSTLSHDELIKIMIEMKVMYDEELREARDGIIMKQFRIDDLETLKHHADNDIAIYEETIEEHENDRGLSLHIINEHEDTIKQHEDTIKQHEDTIEEHEDTIDEHEETIENYYETVDKLRETIDFLETNYNQLANELARVSNK